MNNSAFINQLKQKNHQQSVSEASRQIQSVSEASRQIQSVSEASRQLLHKFNPDVNNNYDRVEKFREQNINSYTYTNNVWKPIIGSVEKIKITENDLKIELEKPNHILIKSKYDQEMDERMREKEMAKQMSEEYAKENNLYANPVMDEIQKPIKVEQNNEMTQNIDNSFFELKQNSNNILKDNEVDQDALLASMNNLDDLMKSIQDL